jgi:hypothetical protein
MNHDPTSDDPEAFLRFAKTLVRELADRTVLGHFGSTNSSPATRAAILTESGRAAATLLAGEFAFRFPQKSGSEVGENLFAEFDLRLHQLAGGIDWRGGTC